MLVSLWTPQTDQTTLELQDAVLWNGQVADVEVLSERSDPKPECLIVGFVPMSAQTAADGLVGGFPDVNALLADTVPKGVDAESVARDALEGWRSPRE